MNDADRTILLEVLNRDLAPIGDDGCRLLVEGQTDGDAGTDSYQSISWDRYFDDLSRGAFRTLYDGKNTVWRSRAWHFLFKNAALIQKLYSPPPEGKPSERKILDLGCSSGFLRRMIEGNTSPGDIVKLYYWGMDRRIDKLRLALDGKGNMESGSEGEFMPSLFIHQDLKYVLPFHDGSFDVVINFEMIKYLPIGQGQQVLAECRRVIKGDGEFFLSTSDYSELADQGLGGFMRSCSYADVIGMVEHAGFRVIQKSGSQSRIEKLRIPPEHAAVFRELIKHHPPELIAAMMGPLYPDQADQITLRCTPS